MKKKNSAGKMQNYDPKTGRYAKANIIEVTEQLDYVSILYSQLVDEKTIEHICLGEYTKESKRHISGGHSQDCIDKKMLQCEINIEYNNGVRVGNIYRSINSHKNRGNNHTWFPSYWDKCLIVEAIKYGLSKYKGEFKNREIYIFEYRGVKMSIIFGDNKKISTVFPNKDQDGGIKYDNR